MPFRRQSLILGGKPNLKNGLIAWYDLEEAAGATRIDATGRGNNLTDHNTVGQVTGIVGNGAGFVAASSQYASRASNADLTTGNISFTWAAWAYVTDESAFRGIVGKSVDASGNNLYEFYLGVRAPGGGKVVEFVVGNGTTHWTVDDTNFGIVPLNTWVFVVAWLDASASSINVVTNNGTVKTTTGASGYTNAADLTLGGDTHGSGASFFNGRLDSIGFWKRTLTAAERTWLYNGGVGRQYRDL